MNRHALHTPFAGIVEGFYGTPWTHEERLALLHDAPSMRLSVYLYAPKSDPWHRERWREPYPSAELAQLADLARAAEAAQVRFVWSVAPGLSIRYADPAELTALELKCEQIWGAGVRQFSILFDDVPLDLTDPDDVARYGAGPGGLGRAHGALCHAFEAGFLAAHRVREDLWVCPTDYAGCDRSDYRDGLRETLPADARILWTGRDIVVGTVSRNDVDEAAASYGRRLVLWDNYPVNDFDRSRAFLGPLPNRPREVTGSALDGILANTMVEARPSRFAVATVGRWAANPESYDAFRAGDEALRIVARSRAAAIAPLVRACSSWPPSAVRDGDLLAMTERALDHDSASIAAIEERCRELLAVPRGSDPLLASLDAWIVAGHHVAAAALRGCALLTAGQGERGARANELRAAIRTAEVDFADVLRPVLLPFARAALRQEEPDLAMPVDRRAVVLSSEKSRFANAEIAAWLARHRFAAEIRPEWSPADEVGTDLIVVTPQAHVEAARAARDVAVPLLAWGRLLTLGLATESGVLLDTDEIVAGEQETRVHRGPGKVTWSAPVAAATVQARSVQPEGGPVIVWLRQGAPSADGTPVPAPRMTLFLTEDGPARWLLTQRGFDLIDAALVLLVTLD